MVVVDLFYGPVEVRKWPVHDAHLLIAFVHHFMLMDRWSFFHSGLLEKLVYLRVSKTNPKTLKPFSSTRRIFLEDNPQLALHPARRNTNKWQRMPQSPAPRRWLKSLLRGSAR